MMQNLLSLWNPIREKRPSPTPQSIHVIFFLPNIYEHISGVSNKYIAFIEYLCSLENPAYALRITLCDPSNHLDMSSRSDMKIPSMVKTCNVTGIPVPLYPAIRIPLGTGLDSVRKTIRSDDMKTIIIFNSEFFWLYSTLVDWKKKSAPGKVVLIPNMHTDIDYYLKHYLGSLPLFRSLPIPLRLEDLIKPRLLNGDFDKFLVTGDLLYQKYSEECELGSQRILNVNEIDTGKFTGAYRRLGERRRGGGQCVNVIYCGRVGVEKNILHNFLLCDYLLKFYLGNDLGKIQIHIIGKGPYLDDLRSEAGRRYPLLFTVCRFHGSMNHTELCRFYQNVENPIFLFSSKSETFGKTSAEAIAAGIPLFHIHSPTADLLYHDSYNAFLFGSPAEFVQKYDTYMKMNGRQLDGLDRHMREFAKKYDQRRIFEEWCRFLVDSE
jgi:Glycosyl transferases group 1